MFSLAKKTLKFPFIEKRAHVFLELKICLQTELVAQK